MLTRITCNTKGATTRRATLQGRDYIVAPLAMITEGVHNGSGGALLYRENEIKRAVPAWNMKPIVVYHPEIDGKGVTACDPVVLEKQQVGVVMNTRYEGGKLRAEAWIEETLANKVDPRVTEALQRNKVMEVSTGLFTENVGGPGKWGEKEYVAEATNHQPDHLALLPDQIGACSVADGAGLLVANAMSNANTYAALTRALDARFNKGAPNTFGGPYIMDVYPDFFIYEAPGANGTGRKLFKLGYTATKDDVTIDEGTPEEVVRVTEYRTADKGKFVGNEAHTTKESTMKTAKEIVDGLIANGAATGYGEGDRDALMKIDPAILNKMACGPKGGKGKGKDGEEPDDDEMAMNATGKPAAAAATPAAPVANATPAAPLTAEQYVNAAPAEIRELLTNGLATANAEKAKCIATITANANNKFSKEFLGTKSLAELQGLAALAAPPAAAPADTGTGHMFFGGQATPAAPVLNAAATTDDHLVPPTMNFEKGGK